MRMEPRPRGTEFTREGKALGTMADEGAVSVDERYVVPGLLRGLQMLETFSRDQQYQTVAELARRVGINRSTAFRIVHTLEAAGFLKKAANSRHYQLGVKVLELGHHFLSGKDIVEAAGPVLKTLRDETNTSTHLIVREGREIVYVARFPGTTSLVSSINVGSRLPAHTTAPGRVLLAGLEPAELDALYKNFKFEAYTPDTPTSKKALLELIAQDKARGTVVSWGFYDDHVATISTPVYNASSRVEAAVSVSFPINTYPKKTFETVIRRAVESAAAMISRDLGYVANKS